MAPHPAPLTSLFVIELYTVMLALPCPYKAGLLGVLVFEKDKTSVSQCTSRYLGVSCNTVC